MLLKIYKPKTPGQRHLIGLKKNVLFKNKFLKFLSIRLKKHSGRNSHGHITCRHRGGGYKLKYQKIITNNPNNESKMIILGTVYKPQNSSLNCLAFNLSTKKFGYVPMIKNTYPGTVITFGSKPLEIKTGNRLPIKYITTGNLLCQVGTENKIFYAKAGGTHCQLMQKNTQFSKIKLPSGQIKNISSNYYATIGSIANDKHNLQIMGKAGKKRLKGQRSSVRGVAMNPVDHPHGGGGGKPSVTPWGKPTKG